MTLKTTLTALMGALLLSACGAPQTTDAPAPAEPAPAETAAEPQTEQVQPAAALPSGDGGTKIVIYRTSIGGFAVQPKVFVNGNHAAQCTPNRATTVNVEPGTYRISAATLAEKEVTVSVAEGETVYVKCSITIGLLVGGAKLVVVPADKAAPIVAQLRQR